MRKKSHIYIKKHISKKTSKKVYILLVFLFLKAILDNSKFIICL